MTRAALSVLETVLYAEDLAAARSFYESLGLRCVSASGLVLVFRIGPGSVLLVFNPSVSGTSGRDVPSHGNSGPGHIALRIQATEFDGWLARLEDAGIEIEQTIEWSEDEFERAGRSIYVRDPAGNSVELIDADIWPGSRGDR